MQQTYQRGTTQLGHTPCGSICICSTWCYSSIVSTIITQRELRNDSGDIMRRLDDGETFVVTSNGRPVGELTPLRRNRFVSSIAVAAMFANAPTIDPVRFRKDVDTYTDQDTQPRA